MPRIELVSTEPLTNVNKQMQAATGSLEVVNSEPIDPASLNVSEPTTPTEITAAGLLKAPVDIARSVAKGTVGGLEMISKAANIAGWTGGETAATGFGKAGKVVGPTEVSKLPGMETYIKPGAEQAAQSVVAGIPGAAVGILGGPIPAIAGFVAGAGYTFGAGQYYDFKKDIEAIGKANNATPEQIADAQKLVRDLGIKEGLSDGN